MTNPMHCRSYKPAQYVCINKLCKQKIAFVCADQSDSCKKDHESCSFVSWNFLVKRVTQLEKAQQRITSSEQLQRVFQSLKSSIRQIENLLNTDEKNCQMTQIIQTPFISADKKVKISEFINQSIGQPHTQEQEHPSARKIQVQLDDTRMRILQFMHMMKQSRKRRDQQGLIPLQSYPIEDQSFNQQKILIKKKPLGSQIYQRGSRVNDPKQSKLFNPQQSKVSNFSISPSKVMNFNNDSPSKIVGPSYVSSKPNQGGSNLSSPVKSKLKASGRDKKNHGNNFSEKMESSLRDHVPRGPLFSKITNDIQTLYTLFYEKFVKASLLYRASENDFLVSKFHQKCNGKINTLTIVLTQSDKVIGGYTPLPWRSGGGDWYQDQTDQSFLFSLSEGEKYALKSKQKAIWCSKTYGPSFGYPDLEISDRAIHNQNSCAKFPMCYNNGNYVQSAGSTAIFCGSKTGNFRIKEWQVYELQFPN